MSVALRSPFADPGQSAASLASTRPALPTRADERWQRAAAPVGRFSAAMVAVLFASVAIHALMVATALIANETPALAPHQEIAVEIVQEPAKVQELATAKAEASGIARAEAASETALRKSDPAEAESPVTPKPIETKPIETKPVEPEPAQTRTTPPEPAAAPKQQARSEPQQPSATALADDLAALKNEFAALKQEQDVLKAAAPPSSTSASPAATRGMPRRAAAPGGARHTASLKDFGIDDGGVGPLAGSADAVALPSPSEGTGEAVGYQALVFSQLAKAKGIGGRQGIPASAGIRFSVDDAGNLVAAAVVSPSGEASLDAEALAIVRKAAPFPPPPEGAQRVFVANVNFTPMASQQAGR